MANINAELSIVDSDGNVNAIYPKTYASNVLLSDGRTVESAITELILPVNPSASYKAKAGAIWIEE